jgi:hypothetical protein
MYKKVRHQERPFVLHICIGMTPDAIAKRLNTTKLYYEADYFTLDENAIGEAYDLHDTRPGHFVIIFRDDTIHTNDIAHEAVHVAVRHFRYIGQPLDINSEESYAYMIGWITGIIYDMIYEPSK